MRRLLGMLVALAILVSIMVGPRTGIAQDSVASPTADASPVVDPAPADGDLVLRATIERSAAGPVGLRLIRIVLEPDGESPLHAHPGLELGVVEAGQLAVRVEGRAVLLRAGAASEASELVPVGVEVSLGPGDRIAYAPGALMTFRNPGPEPATMLAATVLAAGPDAPPGAVYPGGAPSAEDEAGVSSEILGEAVVEVAPGTSAVTLERLRLVSGDLVPGFAGPVLAVVEAGALSVSVLAGSYELPAATPAASPAAEAELALAAGQSIVFPDGMAATAPLGGEGAVTLLRLGIVPLDSGSPTAVPADPTTGEPGTIAAGTRVVVVVPEARLRAEPSLDGEVLAGLAQGSVLIVTGAPVAGVDRLWYPVQTVEAPVITGYVASELVAPES